MQSKSGIIENTVLLLTASINPNGMPNAILDTKQRLVDYKNAYKYYLENHPKVSKIIFVDNSGWPLDEIKDIGAKYNIHKKELEYLSFDINKFPREYGKGYGEHNLITTAITEARLAQQYSYIAKLTGRLFLTNLTELLSKTRGPIDLLCDFRDHSIYERLGLTYCGRQCDTRFIVFTTAFYNKYLRPLIENHHQGEFCLEHKFYQSIKPLDNNVNVKCRFPVEAKYRGIAGHKGKNYSGMREICKQSVRSLCRRIFPWLRI